MEMTTNGTNGSGKSVAIELAKPAPLMDAYVPRNYDDAWRLAQTLAKSGMTGTVKTPEAVFLIIATGAELGFAPTASLRGFFSFGGKACPYADTIVAICLRSPTCEYFICTESTAERATFETKRKGSPTPVKNTFTIAEAQAAGLNGKDVWKAYPRDMLRHRAAAPLARMVYPDLVLGLHSIEEMRDAPRFAEASPAPVVQQEVIDGEVIAPPYDDTMKRIADAYKTATSMDQMTEIRADVAKLGLDKEGDDFKALKTMDREAVERIKASLS